MAFVMKGIKQEIVLMYQEKLKLLKNCRKRIRVEMIKCQALAMTKKKC